MAHLSIKSSCLLCNGPLEDGQDIVYLSRALISKYPSHDCRLPTDGSRVRVRFKPYRRPHGGVHAKCFHTWASHSPKTAHSAMLQLAPPKEDLPS